MAAEKNSKKGKKKQPEEASQKTGKKQEKATEEAKGPEAKKGKETEKTSRPKQKKQKGPFLKDTPKPVIALVIIAGVLGLITIGIMLTQKPIDTIEPPVAGEINVILLVDENCTVCSRYNTILDVFAERNLDVNLTEVSINSEEGKKAVSRYKVNIIPTALVSIADIASYPDLQNAMAQSFSRISGQYVVPELNLNQTKIYSREFLSPPIASDCNETDETITIDIFDNPFHEISIKSKPELDDSLDKFDQTGLEIIFEFLPTTGDTIDSDANQELYNKSIAYLTCSSGVVGKFREMQNSILGFYCDAGGNPKNLADEELLLCNASPHFGTPLSFEELETARLEAGIGANLMYSCAGFFEQATTTSLERAVDYSLRIPTTAIVECKYSVPFKAIDEAICLVNSDLDECKTSQ